MFEISVIMAIVCGISVVSACVAMIVMAHRFTTLMERSLDYIKSESIQEAVEAEVNRDVSRETVRQMREKLDEEEDKWITTDGGLKMKVEYGPEGQEFLVTEDGRALEPMV